jgi:hypothetical protein
MSDWRIASIIGLIGSLILVVSNFRNQGHRDRLTGSFVMRSLAIWAVIILLVTTIVVYRFEIADFFAPTRAMMP